MISSKYECLGEVMVVTDPFLLKCTGFDGCNVYLLAFKLSTLYLLFLFTSSPQKLKQVSQSPDFL